MKPWLILIAVLGFIGSFTFGHWKGDAAGRAFIQQQWDKEKADQYAEYAKGQEAAREREKALQSAADKLREEKDREIKNINARTVALSNSLRNRPERTTKDDTLPGASQSCVGATGAQLARGDGEFLTGYAADAARLEAALNQCIKQYEAVRSK